jgi:hypothetical protein
MNTDDEHHGSENQAGPMDEKEQWRHVRWSACCLGVLTIFLVGLLAIFIGYELLICY